VHEIAFSPGVSREINVQRTNIILVLTDDQGYPPLGCHGHPTVRTPHIDRFYGDAIRFEQFHCGTTCAPTRAGLLTGHYCNSTGVWHTIGGRSLLRKDEWTLATALADGGYRTGIFGKWHLGDDYPYRPQDRGFQTAVCHGGGGIGQIPDAWGNDYFDDVYEVNGVKKKFEGYCTDVFFDEAMRFIEESQDTPFFCYISTNAPHGPHNVEPKYYEPYLDTCKTEDYARFLGMITNIDDNFGRLRAKLQQLDIEDNTLLMFMSDNGQSAADGGAPVYNSNMRGQKGSQYDGGHRIPFIARWTDGKLVGGKEISELTSYVDFMPTLLDICGIETPAGQPEFHGESLMPLLRNKKPQEYWDSRVVVTDTQRVPYPLKYQKSSVMKNRWRLVDCQELYDIGADPSQEHDLASEHPALVAELTAEYETWWDVCAKQFHTDTPISVGNFPSRINGMDLRNESGLFVCGQKDVRDGKQVAGYFSVYAEETGTYAFELCRWPEEVDLPLTAAIPEGEDVEIREECIPENRRDAYRSSNELAIDLAQFQIKDVCIEGKAVQPTDRSVRFEVELEGGKQYELRAFFYNRKQSFNTIPYYIYTSMSG